MKSKLEIDVDVLKESVSNLYSILLSSRELTVKQTKDTGNYLTYHNLNINDAKKIIGMTTNGNIIKTLKSNMSNDEIDTQLNNKDNVIRHYRRKLKLISIGSIITVFSLLSIIVGVYITQTQYKKSGYNSLGKIIIERNIK